MVTCVLLVAGKSSRYGGKIKPLAKVGLQDETLLEVMLSRLKKAGFERIALVVSKETEKPIKDVIGEVYEDMPVYYGVQEVPSWREKPSGQIDALLSVRAFLDGPFTLMWGDNLYGLDSLHLLSQHIHEGKHCLVGYPLKMIVAKEGKVNKGIVDVQDGLLQEMREEKGIVWEDIGKKYTGEEVSCPGLYGFMPDILPFLQRQFDSFIGKKPVEEELLIADLLGPFVEETQAKIHVLVGNDPPVGITYPGDELLVRKTLTS